MARGPAAAAAAAAAIAAAATAVGAFPAFNTPNSVDVDGHTCPLVDRAGLRCPQLCVRAHGDCPAALAAPECRGGEQLCADGACHADCAAVANPCQCGAAQAQLVACPAYPGTVAVEHFDPAIKADQIHAACARQWWGAGASNVTVAEWGAANGADMVWAECPGAHEPQLTFTENFCLAFYGILAAELVLYVLWHAYKAWRERGVHAARQLCPLQPTRILSGAGEKLAGGGDKLAGGSDKPAVASGADSDAGSPGAAGDGSAPAGDNGTVLVRGFDGNMVGAALYLLVLATTAGWIVLLAVIVSDYYGKIRGGQFGLLANSSTSMAVFILVWHLAALWLAAVLGLRARLRNYFRIECAPARARVVQVEERRPEPILSQGAHTRLTRLVARARARVVARLALDIAVETCRVQRAGETSEAAAEGTAGRTVFFEYHCTRYTLDDDGDDDDDDDSGGGSGSGRFAASAFALGETHDALLAHARRGLSAREARRRLAWLGENFIRVRVPRFPEAFAREVFGYFYLYQMLCFWVWCYFAYYKPALVQICLITATAVVKVAIRQRSERRVKQLAERRAECRARRDGAWAPVDSADLVPGDVVALRPGMELMCDGALVCGEAVVDESSLTGEAMPVRKLPLAARADQRLPFSLGDAASKAHAVFAGTRIIQCTDDSSGSSGSSGSGSNEPAAQVLVLATRTTTDQGRLIQRILFPARQAFVFDEQLRAALLVLLAYCGVGFGLSIWLMGHDLTSWFYGVFVVSQIAAPLLPAALVAGQTVAAARLRRQRIFCIDLPRILMAGKVRIFCADKTGTLSKSHLDYFAVHVIAGARLAAAPEPEMARLPPLLQAGFAACHAAAAVGPGRRLVGNPVDVAQFRATGWALAPRDARYLDTLVAPGPAPRSVHVVRRHEFQHARQSMSVAVLDPATGRTHVFVKGSFERLRRLARPESVPADYDAAAARWAKQGCYVLALAHRDLGAVSAEDLAPVPRDELEAGCALAALLLFRNQLKDDTPAAIAELREGGTRPVMITGDTALTAVHVARKCGMVDPHVRVLLGDVERGALVWRDADSDEPVPDVDAALAANNNNFGSGGGPPVELAVTSAAFGWLAARAQIRKYLLDIRVFARMTPQGKVDCVRLHMERAVTAMCGDGGNDCGALRAAHVGIALSGAEASIVSPFSTTNESIRACVALLREGRAAVATSVAGYKFIINYATTMAMLEITQFYFSVITSQAMWITVDTLVTTTFTIAITQLRPARRLHRARPTARLLGAHTLASIWGQTLANHAFLFGALALLFRQRWFRCHEFDSRDIDTSLWWLLADNFEAEVISIVSLFQFVNAAAVYNFGYRFRRPWPTNYLLAALYCTFVALISAMLLADPNRLGCLFRVNCGQQSVLRAMGYRSAPDVGQYNSPIGHNVMPRRFRWTLWALCATNIVVCLAYERLVVLGPVGRYVKRRWRRARPEDKPEIKV
ncbi:hypothetical protein H4R18_003339 [Coemansia javaensis]|uniref:P-type ATPase A domain-containing protein n=1 Tax=Coemansia javaensis TaxID=2761396 RepID=A0A9W8LHF7_9FUNG|nr:hypothetical protein H4R18_003339 [Coemansia javaensis]